MSSDVAWANFDYRKNYSFCFHDKKSDQAKRYGFVLSRNLTHLFLLVFLAGQDFLEILVFLVILVLPVAQEILGGLAHQEVLEQFLLTECDLEPGSGLNYTWPCDLEN